MKERRGEEREERGVVLEGVGLEGAPGEDVLPCASSMISAELSAHFPFMVRDSALPVWVLVKVAVALLPITGEELSARVPSLISSLPLVRSEIVAASIPTHPAPAYPLSFPPPQPKENPTLTFHTTPHLHNLPPARILNRKRSMQMELLLHNIKQMRALHIEHLLAASQTHDFAFDFEHGCAVCELDAETIAAEGHDFFFQHERFWACGEELREYADGLRGWSEGHGWWWWWWWWLLVCWLC